jgi:mono/diheme cytochrome c family protein
MLNSPKWVVLSAAALTILALGYRQRALAQNGGPGFGQREGGPRFNGFPGFGGGETTLAVSGNNVYVVRGNMIYRLDAETLEVKAKAELPQAPNPGQNRPQATAPPSPDSGGPNATLLASGRTVFGSNPCMNCHSIQGQGGGRAPDLSHIGANPQHTAEWIAGYVKNPKSVDPGSDMPAFGDRISDQDYQALGAYLASFK